MIDITTRKINTYELGCLITGVSMAALPHSQHVPLWIIVFFSLLVSLRILVHIKKTTPVKDKTVSWFRISQLLLLIFCAIGVYMQFGILLGRDPSVSLLVLLTGFKILETHTPRDFYIANYLGYFLIITNFFYTQSLFTAAYMTITLLIITFSLLTFNDNEKSLSELGRARYAGMLFIQSFPLALVLFVLFPRLSGPLWGLPEDAHSGKTGISDTMEPGALSQLVLSNDVAFRVHWKDKIPKQSELYWRGPVLWHTDGNKWSVGKDIVAYPVEIIRSGSPINYTITIEPHNKPWIFALEIPVELPPQTLMTHDLQLHAKEAINKPQRYSLSSFTDFHIPKSSQFELFRALKLPEGYHEKTRQLVQSWQADGLSSLQIVNKALRMFNKDDFYYTLTPPLLTKDNVDDFLFSTKQGFCEHYAGAFVVMMRAAGIPARVVTGYQGGTFNPVSDYMIIYQRNAHAWTEIWLDEQGWARIDPTAAVSPERINLGIESALPEAIFDIPYLINKSIFARNIWQRLLNNWDMVNHYWNEWVISYGPQRQTQFLHQLGVTNADWKNLIIILFIAVTIVLGIICLIVFKQLKNGKDPAKVLYEKFCRKLERKYLKRDLHEGPLDFSLRAAFKCHEQSKRIRQITDIYITVRYQSNTEKLQQLKQYVQAFNP
jgi:transglutaminase-like putative cysteine protease